MLVIIMIGPSGSGKSTRTEELKKKNKELQIIGRDKIRSLFNRTYTLNGEEFENMVTIIEENMIKTLVQNKISFIIDNTNLKIETIEKYIELIKDINSEYSIFLEIMDVSLKECFDNNHKKSSGKIEEHIIEKQFQLYKNNFNDYWNTLNIVDKLEKEKYVPDILNEKAVIFDMDGTLSFPDERKWFDYSLIPFDKTYDKIIYLISLFKKDNYKIIIVTARENKIVDNKTVKELTVDWLNDNKIYFDEIFIREFEDSRKDAVVKKEIFNKHIRNKYNVQYVLDDRYSVVKMWRKLGLTCLQVKEGDY